MCRCAARRGDRSVRAHRADRRAPLLAALRVVAAPELVRKRPGLLPPGQSGPISLQTVNACFFSVIDGRVGVEVIAQRTTCPLEFVRIRIYCLFSASTSLAPRLDWHA